MGLLENLLDEIRYSTKAKIILASIVLVLAAIIAFLTFSNKEPPADDFTGELITQGDNNELQFMYPVAYIRDNDSEYKLSLYTNSSGIQEIWSCDLNNNPNKLIMSKEVWDAQLSSDITALSEGRLLQLTADIEYSIPSNQIMYSENNYTYYRVTERDFQKYLRSLIGQDARLLEYMQYNTNSQLFCDALMVLPGADKLARFSFSSNLSDSTGDTGLLIEVTGMKFNSLLGTNGITETKGYQIDNLED